MSLVILHHRYDPSHSYTTRMRIHAVRHCHSRTGYTARMHIHGVRHSRSHTGYTGGTHQNVYILKCVNILKDAYILRYVDILMDVCL